MIWFTSDQHFDHKNIIRYCNRPFATVEEMNEVLVTNFNAVVRPRDTVYFLGDIGLGPREHIEKLIKKLNGSKHFIIGNHDRSYSNSNIFKSISRLETIRSQETGRDYVICHYPLLTWDRQKYGVIMCHGHQHNPKQYNADMRDKHILRFDVGVDANDYYPVSEQQLLGFFGENALKNPSFDHHN